MSFYHKLIEWMPHLLAASPAGVINVIEAWTKFEKENRFLTFFKPIESFGFWLWLLLQFSTPIFVAWFLFSFSTKPDINWDLFIKVSVLGIIFTSALNTTTEAGILAQNIKPIFDWLIKISYRLIIDGQIEKTISFWTELEQKLNQIDLNKLSFLENYFSSDYTLSQQERDGYKNNIHNIKKLQNQDERNKTIIVYLKEVRPKNLPEMLKNLKVREDFLKQYFPKSYRN